MDKYSIVYSDWSFVWDLWPLILIFWGLAVILKNSKIKPVIGVLFGILIGIVIFGTIFNLLCCVTIDDYDYYDSEVKIFSKDYSDDIELANLEIGAGAGTFIIKRGTDKLVKGISKGSAVEYDFYTSESNQKAWINIELEKGHFDIFSKKIKNRLELLLNEKPEWDLDIRLGAAKAIFDLSDFIIKDLSLKTGATKTEIKLGNKSKRTDVSVDMGAASLEILIPKSSGCRISGDMVLVAKDFDGFEKRRDNGTYFETDNFGTAENSIYININGAIASLEIKRY